jgi:hypothetical protein
MHTRWSPGRATRQCRRAGFFAAHHVRRVDIFLRNTGNDAHVAVYAGHGNGARQHIAERGGRLGIGRFDPALPRARHAADDRRQLCWRCEFRKMPFQHLGKTDACRSQHALVAAPFAEHRAAGVQQPDAHARRSQSTAATAGMHVSIIGFRRRR